jgi:hypothetical protein
MARLPKPPKGLANRLSVALDLEPSANLVFAHRDADAPDENQRVVEIEVAARGLRYQTVPVVPVRETEAWLLLDERSIRSVVENPSSSVELGLPRPEDAENVSNPKRKLREILVLASGLRGRRLKALKRDFPRHRSRLLERLDCDGLLGQVPAWQRLERRTREALRMLQTCPAQAQAEG